MILFIVPERRRLEQARVAKHRPAPAATAGKPGHNLSPSALSNLPALPPSLLSFTCLGKNKENLVFLFFPLSFFFSLFLCLFFFSSSIFFFFSFSPQAMLWVCGIPAAQRVGKLWEVRVSPSQTADGSCPLCPAGAGSGAAGPALSRVLVPSSPGPPGRGGRGRGWRFRGGVWAGSAACALLGARRGAGIPSPAVPLSRGSSRGLRGQRGHFVLWKDTNSVPSPPPGGPGARPGWRSVPLLQVTAKGGVGDFGTGVLPPLSAHPGMDVGENPLP